MSSGLEATGTEPKLTISVVVVADYAVGSEQSWGHVRGVLAALAQQDFVEPAEYLLVKFADQRGSLPGDIESILPSLRVIYGYSDNSYGLKNEAVAAARSDAVAVLDADCWPDPDWLRLVVQTLREHPDAAAVSGRTEYPRTTLAARAMGLLERSYVEAGGAGSTRHIANNGAGFRRAVYLQHPLPTDRGVFASKEQSEAILKAGHQLIFEPRMRVVHAFDDSFDRDHRCGVGYGSISIRRKNPTLPGAWAARLGYASIPIFVGVRLWKGWWYAVRFYPRYGVRWFASPPCSRWQCAGAYAKFPACCVRSAMSPRPRQHFGDSGALPGPSRRAVGDLSTFSWGRGVTRLMLADARQLSTGHDLAADVCIVGAGAAGLALARELAGTSLRVVVIESGGLQADPITESLNQAPAGDSGDYPVAASRARYFGGATNLWAGVCLPLDAIEFEERDWVPHSGWPFGRDQLVQFYERASAALGVSSATLSNLPAYRRASGHVPRVVESDDVLTAVLQFCGIPRLAATWGREITTSANVTAWLHATAIRFETDGDGARVDRLRAICVGGTTFTVAARAFVLAAGGIENARLLLASNDVCKHGIGNEYDLVGRYFADHYNWVPGYVEVTEPAMNLDFYTRPRRRGRGWTCGAITLREETRRARKLTGVKVRFYSFTDDDYSPSVRALREVLAAVRARRVPDLLHASARVLGSPASLGRFLTWRALRRYGIDIARRRTAYAEVAIEMEANPENRVTLSTERDALGQPRAAVRVCLSSRDWSHARHGLDLIETALERCGVSRVRPVEGFEPLLQVRFAHHQVGTTRMDDRPERGVVDRDCRVHGVANLYVAGSSMFSTVGTANPTLTIVALAIRLADHIKEDLHRGNLA